MKRHNFCLLPFFLLPFLFSNCDDDCGIDAATAYRTYSSLLSQAGASNPTEKILINEIEISIEWTRTATGVFKGVLSKSLDPDKTSLIIESSEYNRIPTGGFVNSTTIEFHNCDRFNVYDFRDGLSNAVIEIKTYDQAE